MHFLSLVDASLGRSALFVLRFPARPFSSLVGKAASPPISILLCPLGLASENWWGFFYKMHIPTPCPFVKNARAPLRSWEFPSDGLCPMFPEEAPKFSVNLMVIFARSGLSYLINLLRSLLSCLQVSALLRSCLAASLQDSYPFTLFPVLGGPKFLKGLIRDCDRCPRNSFYRLIFSLFSDKECIEGLYSLLSRGLSLCIYFLFFCIVGEN